MKLRWTRHLAVATIAALALVFTPSLTMAAPTVDAPGYSWERIGSAIRYSSPHGSFDVTDGFIGTLHQSQGGGRGALGYPVAGQVNQGGSYWFQRFEHGTAYVSGHGAFAVFKGGILEHHNAAGGGGGWIGYPTGPQVSQVGGRLYQTFERAVVYRGPTGTFAVKRGYFDDYHRDYGGGSGSYGYPIGMEQSQGGAYFFQRFERGIIYVGPAGARGVLNGPIGTYHAAQGGGSSGSLGYPIGNLRNPHGDSRVFQLFERGAVYSSGGGTFMVHSGPLLGYQLSGGLPLRGWPRSEQVYEGPGHWYQIFDDGITYASNKSSAAGFWVATVRTGPMREAHGWTGGGRGVYGYPTGEAYDFISSALFPEQTATAQIFQRETMYVDDADPNSDGLMPTNHGITQVGCSLIARSFPCKTKASSVTYYLESTIEGPDRATVADSIQRSYDTTDLSTRQVSTVNSDVTLWPDVILKRTTVGIDASLAGLYHCTNLADPGYCHRGTIIFREPGIRANLACHEFGHAVGLVHGNLTSGPSHSKWSPLMGCMQNGQPKPGLPAPFQIKNINDHY